MMCADVETVDRVVPDVWRGENGRWVVDIHLRMSGELTPHHVHQLPRTYVREDRGILAGEQWINSEAGRKAVRGTIQTEQDYRAFVKSRFR